MTPQEISALFESNLKRVENLVSLYAKKGAGRRGAQDTDVLRAAVVLLHAALEDFLRSHLVNSIDVFDADTLDSYGFPNEQKNPKPKANLSDLLKYKEQTIEDYIRTSVRERIDRYETFNHIGDVKKALTKCRFEMDDIRDRDYPDIVAMIARRHQIVHKADKNDVVARQGHHRTASLGKVTVDKYIRAVRKFKVQIENTDKTV